MMDVLHIVMETENGRQGKRKKTDKAEARP